MKSIHKSFLEPFFIEMNSEFNAQWCVLHSYETLPDYSESDVDMAFSGTDTALLEKLILKVSKENGWYVYQKLWYDAEQSFYYVLKSLNEDIELAIDFLIDTQGVGKYGFETTLLTQDCIYWNGIVPIPNSNMAFSYKLLKRIVKERDLSSDNEYLLEHFKKADITEINTILKMQFSEKGMKILEPYLKAKNFLISNLDRKKLNNLKKKNHLIRFYWETKRTFSRVFSPCGMVLSVSSSLGEEEFTSLVKKLEDKVGLMFRFVKYGESASLYDEFKSLVGSTLIVKKEKASTLQTHWIVPKKKKILIDDTMSIDLLVEVYYKEILIALKERNRFKEV